MGSKILTRGIIQQGTLLNYSSEYKAILAKVTTKPSIPIQKAQNTFVKTLVDGGVMAKMACFLPTAWGMPSAADALLWINNPDRKATLTATAPTYDPLLGFTGNGTSSYIDTTFNPSLDGAGKYTQNDCSAGFLFTNDRITGNTGGSGISSGSVGACVYPKYNSTVGTIRAQGNYYNFPNTGTATKLFTTVRKSSALINLFQNRTILGADISNASGALQNLTMHLLHVNGDPTSFQTDTAGLFFAGSQLIQSDVDLICDAWDILQFSLNNTALMSDDCDGSVIDTNKWAIANSSASIATFEQNNALVMNSLVAGTAVNEYYKNMIYSIPNQLFGVWKFSCMTILNVGSTGYSQIGVRDMLLSDGYMIGFYNDFGKNVIYQIKKGSFAASYAIGSAFEYLSDIKIVITATHKISCYKWVYDGWVQIGVSQTLDCGSLYLYMATRGTTQMKSAIRDVRITKYDFNTLNP